MQSDVLETGMPLGVGPQNGLSKAAMTHLGGTLSACGAFDGATPQESPAASLQVGCQLRGELIVLPPFQDRIPEADFPEL